MKRITTLLPTVLTGGGATQTLVLHDTFTDTNGTLLPAHTIAPVNTPATAWVNLKTGGYGGTITSNRALGVFNSAENYCGLEAGYTDYTIQATMRLNLATNVNRLLVRINNLTPYVSAGDSYSLCWQVRFGNGLIAIYEHVNSLAGTSRASQAITTSAGTDYEVKAVVSGTSLKAYVDGVLQTEYTMASSLTNTKCGIAFGSHLCQIDDFQVFF